jgi:soluble lytic murein transglycosylase-like protein
VLVVGALAGMAANAQAAATSSGRPATYRVGRGETLSGIARHLGISVSSLARANAISDVDRVRAGRVLKVPGLPRVDVSRLPVRLQQQPHRIALIPRFDSEARRFGVPADLLKAVTWLESGWQNDKVSSTNAVGIGQLMPDTVAFVNQHLLRANLDPRRLDHNIRMSARFLAYLLQRAGGDVPRAVASYYQGPGSVERSGPLPVTERYVAHVEALRKKF